MEYDILFATAQKVVSDHMNLFYNFANIYTLGDKTKKKYAEPFIKLEKKNPNWF